MTQEDGVDIEVEDDTEIPHNKDPEALAGFYTNAVGFLQAYGWYVVIVVLLLLYIKSKLEPSLRKMKQKAEDERYQKKFDYGEAQTRLEAMERSRQRLQAEHDAKAAVYAEQQRIREEEKRKQKIEEWDNLQEGKGYHSKMKPKEEPDMKANSMNKPKPRLRQSDYNPLMGGGNSSGFRPSRRSGGG